MNTKTLINSSLCLLVGLTLGITGARLLGPSITPNVQKHSATLPAPLPSSHEPSPATMASLPSPFAVIESPQRTNLAPTAPTEHHRPLDRTLHYSTLIDTLNHIRVADAATLESLADAHTNSHADSQQVFIRSLFQRWSEIDMSGAIAYLQSRGAEAPSQWFNDEVLNTGILVLSQADPTRMLAWLAQHNANALITDAQLLVYQGIAQQDPEHAIQLAVNNSQNQATDPTVITVLSDWATSDPVAAMAWLEQNGNEMLWQNHRSTILYHLIDVDPAAALEKIQSLPNSGDKPYLLAQYAARIARQDPFEAFTWAESLTHPMSRQQAIADVVNHWAMTNPNQLLAHIESLSDADQRTKLLRIAAPTISYAMTERNPLAAIDWADQLPLEDRERMRSTVFQQWFYQSPEPALNWLTQQAGASEMMKSVLPDLPYQDLPLALQMFPTLDTGMQQSMAPGLAYQLSLQSTDEASAWIATLSDPSIRSSAQSGIIQATVDVDPDRALMMAAEHAGDDRSDVLFSTAFGVSQLNPALVESWLKVASLSTDERSELQQMLDDQEAYWYHP